MEAESPPFFFPALMPRDVAEGLLKEAYEELDTGKLLRASLKRQREDGLDPPSDVQYVAEARVEHFEEGLGVSLNTDILVHEEFEGMGDCVDVFEVVLADSLLTRLQKKVEKWERQNRAP